jgi:hypothetical protein
VKNKVVAIRIGFEMYVIRSYGGVFESEARILIVGVQRYFLSLDEVKE